MTMWSFVILLQVTILKVTIAGIVQISFLSIFHQSHAEDFGDTRCSCKCPDAEAVLGQVIDTDYPNRRVYINSSVSAPNCDCEHVVVPVLGLDAELKVILYPVMRIILFPVSRTGSAPGATASTRQGP